MTSPIIKPTNKKFALIIGINYVGTSSELSGCINDANNLKKFLMEKAGYALENILMLADDNIHTKPTKQNILNSFATLVNKANNEGVNEIWLSYSGHGSYEYDAGGDENDYYDEVICPVDYSTSGMIIDDYIYDNLVCKLPQNVTLFSIMDCCHSGTIYDLPCLYTTTYTSNNTKNKHVANVISISGCKDSQTSADAYINNSYQGAMTWSFLNALANANDNINLIELVDNMRILLKNEYTQIPMLAVSNPDLYNFSLMGPEITPEPVVTTKPIKFKIKVDYWFKESSWNVWSVAENKYIFPTFKTFTYKYQTIESIIDLAKGTYKLCVKDTYGDGGVTSVVSDGLITLVSAKMSYGRIAEYTFDV